MNGLTLIELNGQFLVDSREVAEMVDKNHGDLLRDIKRYVETLGKSNFALADFFKESTYEDVQGKPRLHYLLTRKGCDMVANKMTGEKGVLFTATYVTKFEEMERKLQTQDPYASLSPELKAIFIVDKRTQEIETRVEHLENNTSIERGQRQFLRSQAHANVVKLLGGKESPAYQNSKLRSKTFSAMWRDYQEYFETNSYENTPKKDFEKAKEYVKQWSPQGKLLREIEEANSQMQMSEV